MPHIQALEHQFELTMGMPFSERALATAKLIAGDIQDPDSTDRPKSRGADQVPPRRTNLNMKRFLIALWQNEHQESHEVDISPEVYEKADRLELEIRGCRFSPKYLRAQVKAIKEVMGAVTEERPLDETKLVMLFQLGAAPEEWQRGHSKTEPAASPAGDGPGCDSCVNKVYKW